MKNSILVLDFGSQYTQLIARRVRELGVYAEILPHTTALAKLQALQPKGIILSGGPQSALASNAPSCDTQALARLAPLLAICYSLHLLVHQWGGKIKSGHQNEYGLMALKWTPEACQGSPILKALCENTNSKSKNTLGPVWMSHADSVLQLPPDFEVLAHTAQALKTNSTDTSTSTLNTQHEGVPALVAGPRVWGVQFHPEVTHTQGGREFLKAFVFKFCQAQHNWSPRERRQHLLQQVQHQVGPHDHVLCALSGGVDSSVLAVLLTQALGPERVHCVFVDTGLLRYNEFDEVLQAYKNLKLNIKGVQAGDLFLKKLAGVTEPEQKRKIIGHTFIDVFVNESQALQQHNQMAEPPLTGFISHRRPTQVSAGRSIMARGITPRPSMADEPRQGQASAYRLWLAQGTLYPDVIESISPQGAASVKIKSHHNVGGLPKNLKLPLLEPFNELFKDEVRELGRELKLPDAIVDRHPFPGPGLALRVIGEVRSEKLKLLQQADRVFLRELKKHNLYSKIWQAFCVLLPVHSVGVGGDGRSYEQVVALRAVTSVDGMTADWFEFEASFLRHISNCITNEVRGINRVVYDVTSKPPGTIEWE